ncbi:unnamed protein product, partial [Ectocarpus sp. 12 AP-2014]
LLEQGAGHDRGLHRRTRGHGRVTNVTLEPIKAADLSRLSHFSLPPDQAGFADLPAQVLGDTPDRDGHVILADGTPAGFFAIDRDYAAAHDFATP